MDDKLWQTKINAISAKILHRKYKGKYETYNVVFYILTCITPLIFIASQYVAKGETSEAVVGIISFVFSVILIGVTMYSTFIKVNDKITLHKIGLKDNIYVINECDNVKNYKEKDRFWFYKYVSQIDSADNDTFANVSKKEKQEIYREALKEVEPGNSNVVCPVCSQSPWKHKFIEGSSCQLCGNGIVKNN